MNFATRQPVSMALSAVVIRKDGTREDLGQIAYWHRNPLKRFWWALTQRIQGKKPGKVG